MKRNKLVLIALLSAIFLASCDDLITSKSTIDGTWQCAEDHENKSGTQNYFVDIEYVSSDSSQIKIFNFLNLSSSLSSTQFVTGRISGSTIRVTSQDYNSHTVQGTGQISGNYKTITWTCTDDLYGGEPWDVSSTYTKYE